MLFIYQKNNWKKLKMINDLTKNNKNLLSYSVFFSSLKYHRKEDDVQKKQQRYFTTNGYGRRETKNIVCH